MRDPERQAAFLYVLEDLRWHLQGRRAHECQVGAEFRERVCERMYGAAVLEVANQDDVLALERAAFVPDRVQVLEGLRRVLARSVARVDDGLFREVLGQAGRALLRVAQDDRVAVRLDHPDRIGEGLALLHGRALRAAEPEDPPSEAGHRTLERQSGTRGRFVENRGEDLALESP